MSFLYKGKDTAVDPRRYGRFAGRVNVRHVRYAEPRLNVLVRMRSELPKIAVKRTLRVYADTSVFGGCFDDEFRAESVGFWRICPRPR
jgi:hypothetical protein